MNEILPIYSELNELLSSLYDHDSTLTLSDYQAAHIRFRGLVEDAAVIDTDYGEEAKHYLIDVNDESGEVVKLHESTEDLTADMEAFVELINRHEHFEGNKELHKATMAD